MRAERRRDLKLSFKKKLAGIGTSWRMFRRMSNVKRNLPLKGKMNVLNHYYPSVGI